MKKEDLFQNPQKLFLFLLVFGLFVGVLGGILTTEPCSEGQPESIANIKEIKKFASEEEFKNFIEEGESLASAGSYFDRNTIGGLEIMPMLKMIPEGLGVDQEGIEPDRYSATNVQVVGIDEPDIVKTDGKNIYFSSQGYYYWEPKPMTVFEKVIPPYEPKGETKIIKAFPADDLSLLGKIDKQGNLLLADDILIIISYDKIYGFDISNSQSPEKKWEIKLKKNNYLSGARLYNGKLYLVLQTRINKPRPCPIVPLEINGNDVTIKCADIYYPDIRFDTDVTYTGLVIDPNSGTTENKITFVGSSGNSVIYMSENALYITYRYYEDIFDFMAEFMKNEAKDLFPEWVLQKVDNLSKYDISNQAKLLELEIILSKFKSSLSDDESLRIENELRNRMEDYWDNHIRDLEKTSIVKIGLSNFQILAYGKIPGGPLNQFALDEYQENLRIATTIGRTSLPYYFRFRASQETVNDVYVLDKDLKIIGSIKDLGVGERIYSVRFINNKGYVVTFKQIDPFFVIDLSNPTKPELKGELKIPGYSSYLHPLSENLILGIGKEGSNVKISLFDVSSSENPKELSKYTLDEYWSDILNTHHAFLLDKQHKIFFLPGNKGGYVFSYENNDLKLIKAVSSTQIKRAIYINDYLYIIGEEEVIVIDENNWQEVKRLELD